MIEATAAAANAMLSKRTRMSEEKMNAVSKDFEAMFLSQMLEQMFGDSVGDSMFGDEQSKEVYQTLMVNEYGKQIAASGGIGIASYIKRELLALQEVNA